MTKVILLQATHYGSPYKKGDLVDVPERVAGRWVNAGIAQYAEKEEGAAASKVINYERDFKAAELQQMAKERDIDGWESMKKAELAQALAQDDKDKLNE